MERQVAYGFRQRLFAKELFANKCDPFVAYRKAGYKAKTGESARAAIGQLFTNINVQRYLAEEFAALSERVGFDQDRAIEETMRLAYSDMRQVATWGPDGVVVTDSATLSDDAAAAVKKVTSTRKVRRWVQNEEPVEEEDVRVSVELYDKPKALGQLQTYIMRGTPLTADGEELLAQLVMVTVRYVPAAQVPAFLEAVHQHVGLELPAEAAALIAEHHALRPADRADHGGHLDAPSRNGA